jgi:hypothetical protein
VCNNQNVSYEWWITRINKWICHIWWETRRIIHSPWSTNISDEPYQISQIVTTKFIVILSTNLKKILNDSNPGFTKLTLFVLCKKGLKTYPHADVKQKKKHYFGLNALYIPRPTSLNVHFEMVRFQFSSLSLVKTWYYCNVLMGGVYV